MVYKTITDVLIALLKTEKRDPRYLEKFHSRYPTVRSLLPEILNYVCFRLGTTYSFRPVSIIIEPLNRCNLSCIQCAVNRGMKRRKGHLEFDLLKKIIEENPSLSRVQFANYGEPLLHKDIIAMISYANQEKKFTNIVTNGVLLDDEMIEGMIKAGLNVITFSVDGVGETYERVRGWEYADLEAKIKRFLEINREHGGPVRTEMNMVEFEHTMGQSAELFERWGNEIDLITVAPLMKKGERKKRCLPLWRSLVVLWDGTVVPCCIDQEGDLEVGNIKEQSIAQIFNGERMRAYRKRHLRGDFPPLCACCNEYFG